MVQKYGKSKSSTKRDELASKRVFSTDGGHMCKQCGRQLRKCRCQEIQSQQNSVASDGIVRLHRDSKGRKGKGVTLVKGLSLDAQALANLAKTIEV